MDVGSPWRQGTQRKELILKCCCTPTWNDHRYLECIVYRLGVALRVGKWALYGLRGEYSAAQWRRISVSWDLSAAYSCISFLPPVGELHVVHFAVFIGILAQNTRHLGLPPQATLLFTFSLPGHTNEGLIMHTVLTIHPQLWKIEWLLNQTREFSSVHFNPFISVLVDPIDFKETDTLKPPLFHPWQVYMGPEINTNRLALVLNIVPSSEITKFNDASLHQSSKDCPTHRDWAIWSWFY